MRPSSPRVICASMRELVGVSEEDDVMADYYQLTRVSGIPPVSFRAGRKYAGKSHRGPGSPSSSSSITIAAAYWWFGRSRTRCRRAPQPASPTPAIEEPAAAPLQEPATGAEARPDDAPAVGADLPAPSSNLAESPAAAPRCAGERCSRRPDAAEPQVFGRLLDRDLGCDRPPLVFRQWDATAADRRRRGCGARLRPVRQRRERQLCAVDGEAYQLPAMTRPNQPLRLTLVRAR